MIEDSRRMLSLIVAAARPRQWVKNLFVLAPLLFGRKLDEPLAIALAGAAFACFCLLSSALYIVNDLVDAEADRAHPKKRYRPIASGRLPVSTALAAASALFLAAAAIAAIVETRADSRFAVEASLYTVLTLAYSFRLKRIMIVDALAIAAGFVLRVAAGAAAVAVEPSHWLIICAFILALYLAFAKRRHEMLEFPESAPRQRAVLGEYSAAWIDRMNFVLLAAAAIFYVLYTVSPDTVALVGSRRLLPGSVFVLYGLMRYSALVETRSGAEEPGGLLLSDRPLWLAVLGWAAYNAAIIYRDRIWP
jgi:4-hydroxybenzoate polyprenyltransferase